MRAADGLLKQHPGRRKGSGVPGLTMRLLPGMERGRQVFMFINLAMLANTAHGGARWVLRKVRNDVPVSARLVVETVSEAERLRLGGHTSAEPVTIELRGNKAAASRNELGMTPEFRSTHGRGCDEEG